MAKDAPPPPAAEQTLQPHVSPSRRRILWMVTLGSGALIGTSLAVPAVGFLLWPLRRREEDEAWAPVGKLEDFELGQTRSVRYRDAQALPWAGFTAQGGAWVRRERASFVALSGYCTHTGCPVRWVEGAQMFLCPCHAGAFNRDGAVVSGPPPAPLQRLLVRVVDGNVEVRPQGVPLEAASEERGERASGETCPFARTEGPA